MAEVKEEDQQKKGGILKIILFVIGGILLIILGLGIGYFIFGGETEQDPSQEVNQIIEGEPKVKDDNNKEIVNALIKAKKRVSYLEVDSPHGHDSFLFPEDSYVKGLSSFLEN